MNNMSDLKIDTCASSHERYSPSTPVITSNSFNDTKCDCYKIESVSKNHVSMITSPPFRISPSKILPFLFLGSKWDATDDEFIRDNRIGFILNVSRDGSSQSMIRQYPYIKYKHIIVKDDPDQDILYHFPDAFDFIDAAKLYCNNEKVQNNSNVLVHCVHGISRSPTIVIGYLMKEKCMNFVDALDFVRSKRLIISPNLGFLCQLREYEQFLISREDSYLFHHNKSS